MRGSGLRRPSQRSRKMSLVVIAVLSLLAMLVAATTASARKSESAARAQSAASGKAHKGKPVKPRKLKLNKGKHTLEAPPAPGAREVDGEPPDDVGGGVAPQNPPPATG